MPVFKIADCNDFLTISEDLALAIIDSTRNEADKHTRVICVIDSQGRVKPAWPAAAGSLGDLISGTISENVATGVDPFGMDVNETRSWKACALSEDVCVISRGPVGPCVWRLGISAETRSVECCSLCLSLPVATSALDASIVEGSGVHAVAVVDISRSPPTSSRITRDPDPCDQVVMIYAPATGWTRWPVPDPIQGYQIEDILLTVDVSSFYLVCRSIVGHKAAIINSVRGLIWTGRLVNSKSVKVSDDGQYVIWQGLDASVKRVNSTHPRLNVYSSVHHKTSLISPEGSLVIRAGFFSGSSDIVWFTVQDGVGSLKTYFYNTESRVTKMSSDPPITSNSACKFFYKTESMSDYPSLACGQNRQIFPLPVSLDTLCLTSTRWTHSSRPELQGLIYSFSGKTEISTKPILVCLHGGPGMPLSPFRRSLVESSDWFLPLVQAGIDVITLAYAGSFGFGDEFAQSSIGKQGIADLADVIDTVGDLTITGRRVTGIFGGSYGGYLTLHAFCHKDERLNVIPKFACLYPYVSSRGCAAETGDFAWEAEYCNVQEENDFPVPLECMQPDIIPKLYEISDQNLQRPLMMFHGDSDPVCPLSQSKQCSNILRQRGAKNVSLTVYRGEGHGFRDKDVRADCIAKLVDFFSPEVVIRLCLSDFFCVYFFFLARLGIFFCANSLLFESLLSTNKKLFLL